MAEATRKAFGEALAEIGSDERVWALDGDLGDRGLKAAWA